MNWRQPYFLVLIVCAILAVILLTSFNPPMRM